MIGVEEMSEQIDWGKAPEGATHYVPAQNDLHHPIWLKMEGSTVLNAGYIGHDHWAHTYTRGSQPCTDLSNAIARPTTASWSGEGLPPAGTVCEINVSGDDWLRAIIKYQGKDIVVWLWDGQSSTQSEYAKNPISVGFRQIRTPEQIAADEREEAILDMERICRIGDFGSGGLAALYDAGYRKP